MSAVLLLLSGEGQHPVYSPVVLYSLERNRQTVEHDCY